MTRITDCDVLIIGCGSGGIGAAIGAAERGANVIIVDKNQVPGGVVSMSWVHNWEPTCGNAPVTRRLWRKMLSYPLGAVMMDFSISREDEYGKKRATMPFELWAYQRAVIEEFNRFENLTYISGARLVSCETDGRRVCRVSCSSGSARFDISAKCFVDATGDIALCGMCGCARMLGEDSRSDFNEEYAPEIGNRQNLNEVNWIYRVREMASPVDIGKINIDEIPEKARARGVFKARMPNGDYTVNICGKGRFNPESQEDYSEVIREQYEIALQSYYWFVASGMFPNWQLIGMAPEMGIRESYRLKARYVLTLKDVFDEQRDKTSFVAMTDHPLDLHGTDLHKLGSIAYGIPYESLLPVEFDNLFVAGRGIGASHIVTSSCRLSRTVMTYGNAAGKAAAICALNNKTPEDINVQDISEFEECPAFVPTNRKILTGESVTA